MMDVSIHNSPIGVYAALYAVDPDTKSAVMCQVNQCLLIVTVPLDYHTRYPGDMTITGSNGTKWMQTEERVVLVKNELLLQITFASVGGQP